MKKKTETREREEETQIARPNARLLHAKTVPRRKKQKKKKEKERKKGALWQFVNNFSEQCHVCVLVIGIFCA